MVRRSTAAQRAQVSSAERVLPVGDGVKHVIDDAMGNPINFNKKTFYGDPARLSLTTTRRADTHQPQRPYL